MWELLRAFLVGAKLCKPPVALCMQWFRNLMLYKAQVLHARNYIRNHQSKIFLGVGWLERLKSKHPEWKVPWTVWLVMWSLQALPGIRTVHRCECQILINFKMIKMGMDIVGLACRHWHQTSCYLLKLLVQRKAISTCRYMQLMRPHTLCRLQ